jgi:hypothetical protein
MPECNTTHRFIMLQIVLAQLGSRLLKYRLQLATSSTDL